MVEDMNNKLEEIVNFFGLKVQDKMRKYVRIHTDPKCKIFNNLYVFALITYYAK